MKRCYGRLHYAMKFQIFIFLIWYIIVNKGVFCLIISYLRIKSYNVLNYILYNNCSTDWSFPLIIKVKYFQRVCSGNLHTMCLFTFHCASQSIFTTLLGHGNCIVFVLKLSNSLDNFQVFSGKLWGIIMI